LVGVTASPVTTRPPLDRPSRVVPAPMRTTAGEEAACGSTPASFSRIWSRVDANLFALRPPPAPAPRHTANGPPLVRADSGRARAVFTGFQRQGRQPCSPATPRRPVKGACPLFCDLRDGLAGALGSWDFGLPGARASSAYYPEGRRPPGGWPPKTPGPLLAFSPGPHLEPPCHARPGKHPSAAILACSARPWFPNRPRSRRKRTTSVGLPLFRRVARGRVPARGNFPPTDVEMIPGEPGKRRWASWAPRQSTCPVICAVGPCRRAYPQALFPPPVPPPLAADTSDPARGVRNATAHLHKWTSKRNHLRAGSVLLVTDKLRLPSWRPRGAPRDSESCFVPSPGAVRPRPCLLFQTTGFYRNYAPSQLAQKSLRKLLFLQH